MLGVKFSQKVSGVAGPADHRNLDTPTLWETLDVQPEELSSGELTDRNEELGCDEKNEDVLEEVTLAKKNHIRGTLGDIS